MESTKKKADKLKRLRARLKELDQQNLELKKTKPLQSASLAQLSGAKGYAFHFEGLRGFCGKSGKDNHALLKKSKPWHMWFHLKDYPSSHLIVEKNKIQLLTDEQLYRAACFLFEKGAPKKLLSSRQVKFEVMFTECRHVCPVKGAKPGLVRVSTYKSREFLWES